MFDIYRGGIAFLATMGAFVTGSYLFYSFAPSSFWFHYKNIEIVEPACMGGPLQFQNTVHTKRLVDYRWNDVLRCHVGWQEGQPFNPGFQDSQNTSLDHVSPRDGYIQPPPWKYVAFTPSVSARCVLESTPGVFLNFYGKKSQKLFSEPFDLVQCTNGESDD